MEQLHLLEKKVVHLVNLLGTLKEENEQLLKENSRLMGQIELLEKATHEGSANLNLLTEEKVVAKAAISNLLESIDSFIKGEVETL